MLSAASAEPLGFNKDIRPILSENCFACHGFDSKHRKAKLRIDVQEDAFKPNKHGEAAIVPGKPEESLIWQRIIATDADDIMPPPESHKKLDAEQKETIRQWIEQGAPYQKHWAFEAPVKTEGGGIDNLVERELIVDGLQFSAEADRPTLIRRVSMALTGLPPTIAEVDAYRNDKADGAYERMVDRYLASQALRRGDGAPLARCGALRRHPRDALGQRAPDVGVPRLGCISVQSKPAI